jgi:MFS family permease
VLFFSTAIALYGYDQDMISMMGIGEESVVGIIVSVYYLGCALGAVFFSWLADRHGRKRSIPLPRYSLHRE